MCLLEMPPAYLGKRVEHNQPLSSLRLEDREDFFWHQDNLIPSDARSRVRLNKLYLQFRVSQMLAFLRRKGRISLGC